MPSVDKKKKKKHSKGKKTEEKHRDKKEKEKKKRFSCAKKKTDTEDSSKEVKKKKKTSKGKTVAKKPRTEASKGAKAEDGLITLANGKRVKADTEYHSEDEIVYPPADVNENKKKTPRKKKTSKLVAVQPRVKPSGASSNEDANVLAKKPPPVAPKVRKAGTKTNEKAKKVKKIEPAEQKKEIAFEPTHGSGEIVKKESDKGKKNKDAKPAAPVVEKEEKLVAEKPLLNFASGDAAASPVTKAETSTKDSDIPNNLDDELTKKVKEDKSKIKDGLPVSQPQKWRGLLDKLLLRGNTGLAKEFKVVSSYVPKSATRRGFDANATKNRFEDVVCIDQSRVHLVGDGYIHANWVEISDTKKAILTQLPMGQTAADFWQMVIDNDVKAVLLIASAFEYNTFNGEATFPGKKDFLHFECTNRHIRVGEFDRRTITKHWTMHTICVNNGDRKKFVHVHHYCGWTHGLAPRAIADIWQIQSVLRKYSGPPVYMSLSGCGRAGTYAAFEIAHSRLHSPDYARVDMSDCIKKVRNGRMHAVQRPTQLKTLYLTMAEHIVNNGYDKSLNESEKNKLAVLIKSFHEPM